MKKLLLSIAFAGFLFSFSIAAATLPAKNQSQGEISQAGNDISDKVAKQILKLAAKELGRPPGHLYQLYLAGGIVITHVGGNYYSVASKMPDWGLLILLEEL